METPFRPREKLFEKQKMFQSINKYVYLKAPGDKITSVAIPGFLAASCLIMIVRTLSLLLSFFISFLDHIMTPLSIFNREGVSITCPMGSERKNDLFLMR